jgi:FkbM family methyltransferase
MKTGLSRPICRAARAMPGFSKIALQLCAKTMAPKKAPWLLSKIAGDLNFRIPIDTQLGNGMPIRVIWTDLIGSSICVDGYYDMPSVRVLRRLLQKGMTFIDVGTHVGQYTLLAANLVAPAGAVHSFEPQPDTFDLLKHNIEANGVLNVHLNQCALGETKSQVQLYVARPDNIGQSSLRRPDNYSGTSITVPCQSLDDYAEEQGIHRIDLIKIDVEGAELGVLKGARKILSRGSKPHLIVEFWEPFQRECGTSCDEMAAFLKDHGYKLFWIAESELVPYSAGSNRQFSQDTFNVLARPEGFCG